MPNTTIIWINQQRPKGVNLGSCRKTPVLAGQPLSFPQTVNSVSTLAGSATEKTVIVKLTTPENSDIRQIKTNFRNVVTAVLDETIVRGKITAIQPILDSEDKITNYQLTARLILDETKTGSYDLTWAFLAVVGTKTTMVEVVQSYDFDGENT